MLRAELPGSKFNLQCPWTALDPVTRAADLSLSSRSGRQAAHPVDDVRGAHGAGAAVDLATGFEQREGGNAADIEFARETRFGVGIEPRQAHPGFQLYCSLRELRCHHLAGAAPRGPEIHHDGDVVTFDVPAKSGTVQLDHLSAEQGLMAVAAP